MPGDCGSNYISISLPGLILVWENITEKHPISKALLIALGSVRFAGHINESFEYNANDVPHPSQTFVAKQNRKRAF